MDEYKTPPKEDYEDVEPEIGYSVVRPIEYNIGRYVPGLTESCVNVFRMEFDPSDFTKDRCSFNFRSPGLNSLMSAAVFLEFSLDIATPSKVFDFQAALGPGIQMVRTHQAVAGANSVSRGCPPKIAFGQGNPLKAAMQSYQLVVNGASLQQTRMDEWSNAVEKLWIPSTVMQRRFGRCGGAWSEWDGTAVSGCAMITAAASTAVNQSAVVAGFTQDSGVSKRCQGLMACTTAAPTVAGNGTTVRTIRVRAPIEACGVLNPLGRGDICSNSCPLRKASFVLPHMNVISLNILWKNIFKTVVKNLSTSLTGAGGAALNGDFSENADITCGFPAGGHKAKLCVSYIRLPSWRSVPQTRTLSSYRISCHDVSFSTPLVAPTFPVIHAGCLDDGVGAKAILPVTGYDVAAEIINAPFGTNLPGTFVEAEWNGVQMSQIPTYLAFVLQKSTDLYTLANTTKEGQARNYTAAGHLTNADPLSVQLDHQFLARNTASACAIMALELHIQASVGSYRYSSDGYPYLKGRSELFRDTLKNSYLQYAQGCEFTWERHLPIVFLQSSDYARGLSSEGASFPITINAKVRFENRRQFCDGTGYASTRGTGQIVLQDAIVGRPIMLGLYMRQSLAITPSSGLVSAQNISHASAVEILSRQ